MVFAYCPKCRKQFHNSTSVLKHLNNPRSSCVSWLTELADFRNNNDPRAAEYEAAYHHLSNNRYQRRFQGPTLQELDGHLNYAFMGDSGGFEGGDDIGLECADDELNGHDPGLDSSSYLRLRAVAAHGISESMTFLFFCISIFILLHVSRTKMQL